MRIMKTMKFLLAMICSVFFMASCSDNDDQPTTDKVPAAVLQSFQSRFKGVEDVQWDMVKNYHVARFNQNVGRDVNAKYSTSAWFTVSGQYCQTIKEVSKNNLPQAVKEALDSYMAQYYKGWEVDDCEMVSREGMGEIYVIEIEKGDLEREISISLAGDILKDVLDDDDEDELLPLFIPEEIKNALNRIFPDTKGITILEIEFDDDEIEIDILEDGRHKEVELDLNYVLQCVEYKITYSELVELIKDNENDTLRLLEDLFTGNGFDITDKAFQDRLKIEMKDHAKKGVSFEIEIKGSDLEINIDSKGNVGIEED